MKKLNLLILILICANSFAQNPYCSNKKVGKYIPNRGLKLYYEVNGKGEPLLFIHGNGGSIDNFN